MRAVAFEPLGELLEDVADIVNMHDRAVRSKDFDEPAHVGSLEMVRKIDGQLNGRNRALDRMVLVPDLNRISQRLDADPVDRELAVVRFVLGVFH